ncbi:MAG: ABC transporter substrate-binding protein [Candidatus Binatia bacterium]|nr:ABC transporter substrate-binding protein [Candidatus Binatia bacterium]
MNVVRRRLWFVAGLTVSAVTVLSTFPATSALAQETPRQVIEQTADAVLAVLRDSSRTSEQKRQQIEEIASARFDFDTVSKLVLARNWKRLSPEQQSRFVKEFRKHLSLTYGRNVDQYNNERAEVVGERQEPDGDWTVKTRILRPQGGEPIAVDYRLRKLGNQWKVIDVIIEGTSLVANFRSQFQEIVSRDGPEKLIQLLEEKNARGEPIGQPPGTRS